MAETITDRIEKRAILRAPRSRVWRALTDYREFGAWFGVTLEAPFAEGAAVRGKIQHPDYRDLTLEVIVDRIQPESYFSYRWHPGAIEPAVDYSREPMTLVEFRLEDVTGGTALTIVESGFDRIPLARRAESFRMNEEGWTEQLGNIEGYVART